MHHKKKNKSKKMSYEMIFGAHSIIEMLKAKRRRLISIYTTKPLPKSWNRIKNHLPRRVDNIQYVSRDVLTKMAGTSEHMGVVALVSPFKYSSSIFDAKKNPFILVLDGIQDVRNLGAILRSAYCTGVDGVVICQRGGALINAAVHKTSAGLVEHLKIYQAPSIGAAVREIKTAGYNMYMAVLVNGKNAMEIDYKAPKALVIGNEAVGISKDVLGRGELITLPQRQPDISYNASVAAGILLFVLS